MGIKVMQLITKTVVLDGTKNSLGASMIAIMVTGIPAIKSCQPVETIEGVDKSARCKISVPTAHPNAAPRPAMKPNGAEAYAPHELKASEPTPTPASTTALHKRALGLSPKTSHEMSVAQMGIVNPRTAACPEGNSMAAYVLAICQTNT